MHEEDEMQKGRMCISLVHDIDFVPSGLCCELLTCLTVNIAVCGSWSRRVEYLERVYIAGSSSSRSALIYVLRRSELFPIPNSGLALRFWAFGDQVDPVSSFSLFILAEAAL